MGGGAARGRRSRRRIWSWPGRLASAGLHRRGGAGRRSRCSVFDCDVTNRESIERALADLATTIRGAGGAREQRRRRSAARLGRQPVADRRAADRSIPPHGRGQPARHVPGDAGGRRRRWPARGSGSIVNIGSLYASVSPDQRFYDHLAGDLPFLKSPAYGASKAAVVNMTKYFATLWGPQGVRVNTLSPGGVLAGRTISSSRSTARACRSAAWRRRKT